jgi:hypothetical protein
MNLVFLMDTTQRNYCMVDYRLLLADAENKGFPKLRMGVSSKSWHGSISESMKDPTFLVSSREAHVDSRLERLIGPIRGLLSYLYLQSPTVVILPLYLPIPVALSSRGYASVARRLFFITFDSTDLLRIATY